MSEANWKGTWSSAQMKMCLRSVGKEAFWLYRGLKYKRHPSRSKKPSEAAYRTPWKRCLMTHRRRLELWVHPHHIFYITKLSNLKHVCEIWLKNPKISPYPLTSISQRFPSSLLVLSDHKRICGREGQSLPVNHENGAHENGWPHIIEIDPPVTNLWYPLIFFHKPD